MFSKYECAGREPETDFLFNHAPATAYRFGNVDVDFRTGELRKSGLRVRIQNQPLQVLAILLLHRGEIVTRDQFRELLWPADTFVDFDHGLNSAIKRLRDALDDDSEHPRLVETVPRHGYRFIAPISELPHPVSNALLWQAERAHDRVAKSDQAVSSEEPLYDSDTSHAAGYFRRRTRIWLGCGAALLVVMFLSKPTYGPQRYVDYGSSGGKLLVAVLPFQNLSGNSSDNFIAEGTTQEVITQIGTAHGRDMVVISGTALAQFKSLHDRVSVVGKELGVRYVIEGSTRIQGTRLRIAVQLIRVRDQSFIWGDAYEGDAQDILTLESTVAAGISRAVSERLPR